VLLRNCILHLLPCFQFREFLYRQVTPIRKPLRPKNLFIHIFRNIPFRIRKIQARVIADDPPLAVRRPDDPFAVTTENEKNTRKRSNSNNPNGCLHKRPPFLNFLICRCMIESGLLSIRWERLSWYCFVYVCVDQNARALSSPLLLTVGLAIMSVDSVGRWFWAQKAPNPIPIRILAAMEKPHRPAVFQREC